MTEEQFAFLEKTGFVIITEEYALVFAKTEDPGDLWYNAEYNTKPSLARTQDVLKYVEQYCNYKISSIPIYRQLTEKEVILLNMIARHANEEETKTIQKLWKNLIAKAKKVCANPLTANRLLAMKMK